MDKEKKEKSFKPWPIILVAIIFVFMMGTLIIGRISKNFYGALSDRGDAVYPESSNNLYEGVNVDELLFPESEEETENTPEKSSADTVSLSGLNPAEAYLAIKKESLKINDLDDFIFFVTAYGSDKNISYAKEFYKLKSFINNDQILSVIISAFSGEIKSAETIQSSESEATVKAVSKNGEEGEIKMVFERDSWRLDLEKWPSQSN